MGLNNPRFQSWGIKIHTLGITMRSFLLYIEIDSDRPQKYKFYVPHFR